MNRTNVYIDGMPLIDEHMSGIGYTAFSTINALLTNTEACTQYTFHIIITKGKKEKLNRWGFVSHQYRVLEIPLPQKLFNGLFYYNLLPPLDRLLGKGIYLFFNFKNWPLTKHSRSITYVHDMAFKVFPDSLKPNLLNIMNRNLSKWMKRADKVVVVSKHAASELHRFYPDVTTVEIIHNGVDHSVYKPYNREEVHKNNLAYRLLRPYFLYVGNIEPRKNMSRLLDAYKQLPTSLAQKFELVIVGGKGWKNDAVLHQIEALNKSGRTVRLINTYVSDRELALLYNGATALLHPALYEGFGLTPLQAMACGTLVVVGNTSSLPEVAGTAGIYCDPENTKDIKTAIEQAAAQSENGLLREALMQQAKLFSWNHSAAKLLRLMRSFSE